MAGKAKKSKGDRPAAGKKAKTAGQKAKAAGAGAFSPLERSILESKGITGAEIAKMAAKGIRRRADFKTVGDAATLAQLVGLPAAKAGKVMSWALGSASSGGKSILVEAGDAVYCVHCKTKQPVDYKSGDLCGSCGKQAEPVYSCFWCSASGPGKYCRQCGAEFVPAGELPLALLLKREGLPRDEIPAKLSKMSAADKDELWGRVHRS